MRTPERRDLLKTGGILATATLGGLAGCSSIGTTNEQTKGTPDSAGWPMFQYDAANSGYHERTDGIQGDSPGILWEFTQHNAEGIPAAPAIAGDRLFLNTPSGDFYSVQINDGQLAWKYSLDMDSEVAGGRTTPIVLGEMVYASMQGGETYVFNTSNGGVVDKIKQANYDTSLTYHSGTIYSGSNLEGVILSTLEAGNYKVGQMVGATTPAVVDGRAYIGVRNGSWKLFSIDIKDGEYTKVWEFDASQSVVGPASVAGETVFFKAGQYLYALSKTDGTVRWKFKLKKGSSNPAYTSSPALSEDSIFVSDQSQTFYKLDQASGELLWEFDRGQSLGYDTFESNPVIVDDSVIISGIKLPSLYGVDRDTGSIKWSIDIKTISSPVVSEDKLFVWVSKKERKKALLAIS